MNNKNNIPLKRDGSDVFYHGGGTGDILALLPIMKYIGGAHLKLNITNDDCWTMFRNLKPLLDLQSYVHSFTMGNPIEGVDIDVCPFSRVPNVHVKTLVQCQAEYIGLSNEDISKLMLETYKGWIETENIEAQPGMADSIIINKTPRYGNDKFDWNEFRNIKKTLYFVGLEEEFKNFCHKYTKLDIQYLPTKNHLEVASYLKSCRFFAGNQSSCFWLACGMGINLIQERWNINSTIRRRNAIYCDDTKDILKNLLITPEFLF